MKLRAFESGKMQFRHFLYSQGQAPADKDGFPAPVEIKTGNLTAGVPLVCPANSVHRLTSIEKK